MERRQFTREFKLEAVRLIKEAWRVVCHKHRLTLVFTQRSCAIG